MRSSLTKLLIILTLLTIFFSCSRRPAGYGLILWSDGLTTGEVENGDVVPLYSESDLRNTYALSTDGKLEIDQWRVQFFRKKEDASLAKSTYAEFASQYAASKADGVKILSELGDKAVMLYRMRKDEVVKIVSRAAEQVEVDGESGYWYEVMTADGTRGFSFGYYLSPFSQDDLVSAADEDSGLKNLVAMLDHAFYPEYFQSMIDQERIVLDRIDRSYGFFVNQKKKTIVINSEDGAYNFQYSAIETAADGDYLFTDSPVKLSVISPAKIQVTYATARGSKFDKFVRLSESIDSIIDAENQRRKALYLNLLSEGDTLSSSAYGVIELKGDRKFTWTNYERLVPRHVPKEFTGEGTVDLSWFISPGLNKEYDGILTLDLGENVGALHFLYKLSDNRGIQLEMVETGDSDEKIIKTRSTTPLVMFFSYI